MLFLPGASSFLEQSSLCRTAIVTVFCSGKVMYNENNNQVLLLYQIYDIWAKGLMFCVQNALCLCYSRNNKSR